MSITVYSWTGTTPHFTAWGASRAGKAEMPIQQPNLSATSVAKAIEELAQHVVQ